MVQKAFIITPWINQKVIVPLESSRPKTNALNEVVKLISLQPCQSLPQLGTTHQWEENPYLQLFPWKGERTVEHPSVLWLFRGLPTEVVLSHQMQSTDEEPEYPWMPGGSREQKRVQQLWQHQRTCNTAERNWHSSLHLGEGAQPVVPPCIKHSSFVEGCLRNWFMSQVTQSTDRWQTLSTWGPQRTNQNSVTFSSAKQSAVPWTDTRGIKRQESPEKETGKPLSLEKHMYKPRDYTFPKKFWEAPQISSLADWWSSFPVWCKSVKVERNDFLFQMHTSQHIATSHMKKQGNMAQSKDENKSPETKPQITEIYEFELPKKEFNITIIKNSIWSKKPL